MDSSRKQFRALNMAQPIKKQINETLTKLQIQKRRFLSFERQQMGLKQQLQRVRRQLNEVKLLQPKTRVKQNKNTQANMSINNTERLYLSIINKISQMRTKIDVHRKQIQKYKRLQNHLNQQVCSIKESNNGLETELIKRQQNHETIKHHLLDYRALNMRNTDEFKNSFQALRRSSVKQENERKKSQVLKKNFNYQQLRNSNIIRLAELQQQNSSQMGDQSLKNDIYMTNCIPLIKQRIRKLIHNNKEKIKISENYKKFGQELQNMFSMMKEYKGRDDVAFIADEFVMKEKQLKKIQQYIGKLENRLMSYEGELHKIRNADKTLIEELHFEENQEVKVKEKQFVQLQHQVQNSIEQLKQQQSNNTKWFNRIGGMLAPLIDGQSINRGNIDKALALIEERYFNQDRTNTPGLSEEKHSKSPTKTNSLPSIDQREIKALQSMELMTYQKLKEYAKDYVARKK